MKISFNKKATIFLKKGHGIDPIAINNYLKVSLPDDISV